jgi:hypothetical protein
VFFISGASTQLRRLGVLLLLSFPLQQKIRKVELICFQKNDIFEITSLRVRMGGFLVVAVDKWVVEYKLLLVYLDPPTSKSIKTVI